MRKRIIAGNWKMNTTVDEAVELAKAIKAKYDNFDIDVVLCAPFTNLYAVHQVIQQTPIGLGAQDVYWEEKGAFTGQISATMLKAVGCQYVIIGHSERRQYFGETDETVNKKTKKAFEHHLTPIVCVGELLQEREADETETVVERQMKGALAGLSETDVSQLIIAYEPVWAIGTGKVATPQQAQDVHEYIRGLLEKMYNSELAESIRIQYGGSMKPDNASDLLAQPDIDGGLIGGASLQADSFLGIINA
ncbi:triose-phosphate isomerase [candidate division KSB1 bacterium]|nr:triose-phosphate isomerase [candidate division KSB1 bacterium]RQW00560.1 MAG: triose-phosphate isomerase [candidate division KSB1 bacterium]